MCVSVRACVCVCVATSNLNMYSMYSDCADILGEGF